MSEESDQLLRLAIAVEALERRQADSDKRHSKTDAKIDTLTAQQNRWQGAGMILLAIGGLVMGFLALGDRLFKP